MITQLFRKQKTFKLERTYSAPPSLVWEAWTRPEMLREWWGPKNTSIDECEIDLQVGGRIYVVMVAGEGMGKYKRTRWPMEGAFTHIEAPHRLTYEARSWTDGEEATTTIEHVNEVTLSKEPNGTRATLNVTITKIGPKAKMAAFGMKWGYKANMDKLETFLSRQA